MGLLSSIGKSAKAMFSGGLDATGLLSAGLGFLGASNANKANSAQAARQMAFQESMRSTSYQTAMDDMRKAGLNPIFAYQQGGAPMAMGAQATMQNSAAAGVDAYNSSTNTAISSKRNRALLQAELDAIKASKNRDDATSEAAIRQAQVNEAVALKEMQKYLTEVETTTNAQLVNELTKAQLPGLKKKAEVYNENPSLITADRLMDLLGRFWGQGSSAAVINQLGRK